MLKKITKYEARALKELGKQFPDKVLLRRFDGEYLSGSLIYKSFKDFLFQFVRVDIMMGDYTMNGIGSNEIYLIDSRGLSWTFQLHAYEFGEEI